MLQVSLCFSLVLHFIYSKDKPTAHFFTHICLREMDTKTNNQFTGLGLQGLTASKAYSCVSFLAFAPDPSWEPRGLDLMALFLRVRPPFSLHPNSDMHPLRHSEPLIFS